MLRNYHLHMRHRILSDFILTLQGSMETLPYIYILKKFMPCSTVYCMYFSFYPDHCSFFGGRASVKSTIIIFLFGVSLATLKGRSDGDKFLGFLHL